MSFNCSGSTWIIASTLKAVLLASVAFFKSLLDTCSESLHLEVIKSSPLVGVLCGLLAVCICYPWSSKLNGCFTICILPLCLSSNLNRSWTVWILMSYYVTKSTFQIVVFRFSIVYFCFDVPQQSPSFVVFKMLLFCYCQLFIKLFICTFMLVHNKKTSLHKMAKAKLLWMHF